jgi:protein SCO1/2
MRRAVAIVFLAAAVIAGCGGPGDGAPAAPELEVYDEIGGDFTLTDHRGEPFRLADTGGRVRLLFFGYTMCPDVCPQTLSKVVRVRQLLGEAGDELTTVFVSVDPERDTPEKLAAYLEYFHLGDAVALTGAAQEIDDVLAAFKATSIREDSGSAAGYLISHTPHLFLLDREGRVRGLFGPFEKAEDVAAAARSLL